MDAAGYLCAIADGADAPPTLTPFVLVLMAVGFATQFVPAWTPGTLANLYDRVPLPAKIAVPAGGVGLSACWRRPELRRSSSSSS